MFDYGWLEVCCSSLPAGVGSMQPHCPQPYIVQLIVFRILTNNIIVIINKQINNAWWHVHNVAINQWNSIYEASHFSTNRGCLPCHITLMDPLSDNQNCMFAPRWPLFPMIFKIFSYFEIEIDMPMLKHVRQLTTWSSKEKILQPRIEPPTSSLRFEYLSTIIQLARVVSDYLI